MTKLVVPQIGDIVRGQVVTEAAHKLWVDLVNKVDTLEGVANDDLTDELGALGDRVDSLVSIQNSKPKIQVYDGGASQFNPYEDGYDFYLVIFEATIDLDSTNATFMSMNLYDETKFMKVLGENAYSTSASNATITATITGHFTAEDSKAFVGTYIEVTASQAGSPITITPVRWIVHKYKSEY